MWNSYFFQLQKKYNMRISTKNPLVIRFDGRQVTKNGIVDLLDTCEGGFMDSLIKTAEYFSSKYKCFSILGSDEISFIIPDPLLVVNDLEPSDKTTHSNEIIALFSQYFFDYFNHFDVHKKIFWHGKCFSIPTDKATSYVKYRSGTITNVMVTYFLKRHNANNPADGLEKKISMCKSFPEYNSFEEIMRGVLYFDGKKIELSKFINGVIKEADSEIKDRTNKTDIKMVDDLDIEINI